MKGFTLIELLAVIVILSIILLISVPIINGILEGTKKSAFESSAKSYLSSAKNIYINNQLKNVEEDIVVNFTNGVSSNNKFEVNGEFPKTGTLIIYTSGSIEFALHDGTYCATKNISSTEVVVSKKESSECIIALPELTLIGDANINLTINQPYVEQGVNHEAGVLTTTIKKNNVVVPSVDTSVFTTYEITYRLTVEPKFNIVTRTVSVIDNEPPVLTVPGDVTIEIADVLAFNLLTGVSVTDNSGETITPIVTGGLSAVSGVYNITYTATDSNNNVTTKTRKITVTQPPLIVTNSMTAAQIGTRFTANTNTSRGWIDYMNGGFYLHTSNLWDGAFLALNGSYPRSGELTVEYEVSHGLAHYNNASTGAALFLVNASTYSPTAVSEYYNHPSGSGVHFQTFSNSATHRWNVAARSHSLSWGAFNETYAPTTTPTFIAGKYYAIKSFINLNTGYFEHYADGVLIRSGTITADGLNQMGSSFRIVFHNGNYTGMSSIYRNIKITHN